MKKILIISGCIILIALIAVSSYFLFLSPKDGVKPSKDIPKDILSVVNEDEIKEYINENEISVYGFDEDVAFLMGIEVFGELADVEFYLADKSVVEMNAVYYLFSVGSDEEYPNDTEVIEGDESIYQFTSEDKDSIADKFNKVKENFEEYIGCSFERYDLVPTHDAETLEDNDESFYNGDFIKEYSVRDANGTLWLMRYEASMGSSTVVISKIVDESNFEGFIPGIDLTKTN